MNKAMFNIDTIFTFIIWFYFFLISTVLHVSILYSPTPNCTLLYRYLMPLPGMTLDLANNVNDDRSQGFVKTWRAFKKMSVDFVATHPTLWLKWENITMKAPIVRQQMHETWRNHYLLRPGDLNKLTWGLYLSAGMDSGPNILSDVYLWNNVRVILDLCNVPVKRLLSFK